MFVSVPARHTATVCLLLVHSVVDDADQSIPPTARRCGHSTSLRLWSLYQARALFTASCVVPLSSCLVPIFMCVLFLILTGSPAVCKLGCFPLALIPGAISLPLLIGAYRWMAPELVRSADTATPASAVFRSVKIDMCLLNAQFWYDCV